MARASASLTGSAARTAPDMPDVIIAARRAASTRFRVFLWANLARREIVLTADCIPSLLHVCFVECSHVPSRFGRRIKGPLRAFASVWALSIAACRCHASHQVRGARRQYFDLVADADRALIVRDQLLAEHRAAVARAMKALQRAQGFVRVYLLARVGIARRDRAARARLCHAKADGADPDRAPSVLRERGCARDHEIRPEPAHGDVATRSLAQIGKRVN